MAQTLSVIIQPFELFSQLARLDANSLVFTSALLKQACSLKQPAQEESSIWSPLRELASVPAVSFGTTSELCAYQSFVCHKIDQALSAAKGSRWSQSGLLELLDKALQLVKANRTSAGRQIAVELIGFAALAEQFTSANSAKTSSGLPLGTGTSVMEPAPEFKIPALPAKRCRRLMEKESLQSNKLLSVSSQQQLKQQQQSGSWQPSSQHHYKKHHAPKRRATPQLLQGAMCNLAATGLGSSNVSGDACSEEQLLTGWGNQRDSPPQTDDSTSSSYDSTFTQTVVGLAAPLQVQQQPAPVSKAAVSAAVPATSTGNLQPVATAAPTIRSSARVEAAEAVKRLIHEDSSSSKPTADVLLFSTAKQQPIVHWTGTIKHRADGRVVELCSVTLQVPEPFVEEFPAVLYAADIRHRRSVSLGRHVVCRASLGALSEHQLAGLAAMARSQLVALCSLQTAELHLVPYFDNKNLVRMVGFLKVKSE